MTILLKNLKRKKVKNSKSREIFTSGCDAGWSCGSSSPLYFLHGAKQKATLGAVRHPAQQPQKFEPIRPGNRPFLLPQAFHCNK